MFYFKKFCFLALLALPLVACKTTGEVKTDPTTPPKAETEQAVQSAGATTPSTTANAPNNVKVERISSAQDLEGMKKKAAAGDVAAKASLAVYYYNHGEPIDVDLALQNGKDAAEAGVVEGKYVLGAILLYSKDDRAAQTGLKVVQEASEAGYAPATAILGKYYLMGRIVPRDENQARKLFAQAAEKNDPEGLYGMGMLYATGTTVSQDFKLAADFFRKSAEQNLGAAQMALATLYANGQGVERNVDEAVRWFTPPATAGNSRAQTNLGTLLIETEKDPAGGVKWLRKAASQNSVMAQFFLAQCYLSGVGVTQNHAEAFKLCSTAANAGLPIAQGMLGMMYFNGLGTDKDPAQSANWFKKAAEWGDSVAMYHLAGMYMEGLGVKKDLTEAYFWALIAEASEPIDETRQMREAIAKEVNDQQRQAAERKAKAWKPKAMPM